MTKCGTCGGQLPHADTYCEACCCDECRLTGAHEHGFAGGYELGREAERKSIEAGILRFIQARIADHKNADLTWPDRGEAGLKAVFLKDLLREDFYR